VSIDLAAQQVTFARPTLTYTVERKGDVILWNGGLVRALRHFMGFTQAQLADEMGVRQETISEWENGVYAPSRANSKYLSLVAERAGFLYEIERGTGEAEPDE
jgi:DNA-binding transcriptional regulator YiaG